VTVREKAWRWLALTVVFISLVWLFKGILLPFVAGAAIAYFLDPVADRMERAGIGRGWAAAWVLLGFFVLTVAMLLLLVPIVQAQIVELAERLPRIDETFRLQAVESIEYLRLVMSPENFERLKGALTVHAGQSFSLFTNVAKSLFSRSLAVFEFVSVVLVTPVVAFYLLRDWDRMIAELFDLVPLQHRETVRVQVELVDDTLAGFARGQATVCLLLGFGYGAALALAGLPFGFTIGLMAGLVSFIPYLGTLFGLIASLGLALLEFDDPIRIVIVAAIFLIGQVIEGNFLTPKLVGERVRLHPVWVIFALFAGGSLMGFVGMLIALPAAAVIGVVVRFLLAQYRMSHLYDHTLSVPAGAHPATPEVKPLEMGQPETGQLPERSEVS